VFSGLLTALFRGTDLVPSDVMAGCILLRVQQKRETHELRRLNLISRPKYTSGKLFTLEINVANAHIKYKPLAVNC